MERSWLGKIQLLIVPQPKDFVIDGNELNEKYWVVGMKFLVSFYTIYDWNNQRIGIVPAN
jgi:hypothetical protein